MSALWGTVAAQLGVAARKVLSRGGRMALRGVPDLSMDRMGRLAHGAMLAQGAESWMSSLAGHRVQRYAFAGEKASGPAVLLLHGLGGSASSMTPLLPALVPLAPRVVLLELPGHGRSPHPAAGPLSARTPLPFWLVARDFARHWGTPTVQRILDDARKGNGEERAAPATDAGRRPEYPAVARHRRAHRPAPAHADRLGRGRPAAAAAERGGLCPHRGGAGRAASRVRPHPTARAARSHPPRSS